MYLKYYICLFIIISVFLLAALFLYTGLHIGKKMGNYKYSVSIFAYTLSGISITAIVITVIYMLLNVKTPIKDRMYCADCGCYRHIDVNIYNDMVEPEEALNLLVDRMCSVCGSRRIYSTKEAYEKGFNGKMKDISDDAPTGIISVYD